MSSKNLPRKINRKPWVLAGVGLFLLFVLINIPAVWGGYLLTRSGSLALSGVTGTLWNGRASLASLQIDSTQYSLGQLSWSLNPWSLLALKPCLALHTKLDKQLFDGEVCAGIGQRLQINDADIVVPAALLQSRIPIPVVGQFSGHVEALELKENVLHKLKGNLSWTDAQVNNGANWIDIGSYAAELTDDGKNGVSAKLFDLSGPLDVELEIGLAAPSGARIQGKLIVANSFIASSNAAGLLAMFAQEESVDAEGKAHYRIDINL